MKSMVEILAAHAAGCPERLFVADHTGNAYTYRQAWEKVLCLADCLRESHGVAPEDKVMVECSQDAAYLLVDMACELIGAVFVPIENGASLDRKQSIYNETEACLWIAAHEDLTFVNSTTFARMLSWEKPLPAYEFPSAEAIAQILYTTGTTGRAKGIVITNGANVALAENIKYGVQMKPGNIEFIPLPISHSHGLRCCYANLLNGGTIVLMDGIMKIKQVFQLLREYHVTAMDLSPSAAQLLIKVSKGAFWEYGRSMDYIQIGTAALPESLKTQLVEELPGVRLYNFYGSTESGRSCVLDFSSVSGKMNCIGQPTRNAEIVFADEDRHIVPATADAPGLLASRGKMNMACYWKNPQLTAEIMQDGFVFTNDMGYMDEEGYVFVLGRKDDVINYNGIKISPEEVEERAKTYQGVRDCACVPQKDQVAGQVPRLFIAVEDADTFDLADYKNYLAAHLDSSMMPKRIDIIDEIPRTFNGKIKRKNLAEQ